MLWLLGHALHLGLLAVGLVGVAWLLLPQVRAARSGRRTSFRPPADAAEHEQRVDELRSAVQEGRLTSAPAAAGTSGPVGDPAEIPAEVPATGRDASTWRAVAVVSSVAAAGVHAAVFPHHLHEAFVVGAFFLAVALAQAGWACLVALDATRDRLVAGLVGNLGLIALWGVSRTLGLPGLGREAVGGWDLAAGAWELILVVACAAGLRRQARERALVLGELRPLAIGWAATSGAVLISLTLAVSQH